MQFDTRTRDNGEVTETDLRLGVGQSRGFNAFAFFNEPLKPGTPVLKYLPSRRAQNNRALADYSQSLMSISFKSASCEPTEEQQPAHPDFECSVVIARFFP